MNRQQQIDSFLLQAHRLAVARLRADPSRIAELAHTLSQWRVRAGATRSDPYWDEWQTLLDAGIDAIESGACGVDDHAAALRNVSPVGVLISATERSQLLQAARRSGNAAQ